MSETVRTVLGLSSGVLMALCVVPYIRDILRHTTKPERATWWVWMGLGVMASIAQIQAGSTWSVVMTIVSAIGCGAIAFLSLRYGYGRFKFRDGAVLVIAALGMIVSQILHSPLTALLIIVAVDMIGYSLTIAKTWHAPKTETLLTWVLSCMSGFLGLAVGGTLNFAQLIYPLYIFLGNALMVVVIHYRRRALS